MGRMYSGVRTWTPYPGCKYDCAACKPTFQRQAKRRPCPLCKAYTPHGHMDRLNKIPAGKTIFVNASGDIAFTPLEFLQKIVEDCLTRLGHGVDLCMAYESLDVSQRSHSVTSPFNDARSFRSPPWYRLRAVFIGTC